MFRVPEKNRVTQKQNRFVGSDASYGNNGFFIFEHYRISGYDICVQASNGAATKGGEAWEHCSVSVRKHGKQADRNPTWEEMCWVKEQFWDEEDWVVQFHPAKSQYVNLHPFVLHLWKPVSKTIPTPDKIMVG